MSKYIDAVASTPITKTGKPFTKYRYTISLMVNEINTTLHAHARTYIGARKAARTLADEATVYLEEAGLMPIIFQKLVASIEGKPELPPVGAIVYLTKDIAGFSEGHPVIVVASEWSEGDQDSAPENTFPVTVMPLEGSTSDTFPLSLDEFTTKRAGVRK